MILNAIKTLKSHGWQSIKDLSAVELAAAFRGLPRLNSSGLSQSEINELEAMCPTGAIGRKGGLSLDMGRCLFCGECARRAPKNIEFTNSWRTWSFSREDLVVTANDNRDPMQGLECEQAKTLFSKAFKLRQVSAGGDGSCEMELNACGNVNFDMRRYGVEFVASPRHADAIVVTGPVSVNMSRELEATFAAIPQPRLIIAVGVDAISGGLFADSEAVDRTFFERHKPNLYVPGNPAHPLTFIGGVRALVLREGRE